ncbi:MAG TPA: hypothetical protein VNS59_08750 [Lysobacter sp.]|nr:hypothetical protein [Lysobacter sp.]
MRASLVATPHGLRWRRPRLLGGLLAVPPLDMVLPVAAILLARIGRASESGRQDQADGGVEQGGTHGLHEESLVGLHAVGDRGT